MSNKLIDAIKAVNTHECVVLPQCSVVLSQKFFDSVPNDVAGEVYNIKVELGRTVVLPRDSLATLPMVEAIIKADVANFVYGDVISQLQELRCDLMDVMLHTGGYSVLNDGIDKIIKSMEV